MHVVVGAETVVEQIERAADLVAVLAGKIEAEGVE